LNATPVADSASPYVFPRHRTAQITFVLLAVYVVYAAAQMEVSWERVQAGLEHAARFLSRMFPPNFERSELLWKGLAESLQIAVLASALGIVLALPFGLLGARNLMPAWISWPARLVVVLARDVRKRSRVEAALAEMLAFRKAMEDSLVTGLRARDIDARVPRAG